MVLSVCDSGVSHDDMLDESIGFPGIVIGAGAGAMVGTLWKVRDDVAIALMSVSTTSGGAVASR